MDLRELREEGLRKNGVLERPVYGCSGIWHEILRELREEWLRKKV